MGNGQCPDCYGVPKNWLGHPLHPTPESIGHGHNCPLAACLEEVGEPPLYEGHWAPTEDEITDLINRTINPHNRERLRALLS